MGTPDKKQKGRKQVLRVTNGTVDDLAATGAEKPKAKGRVRKEPVYTGDDPVKRAYYARKGTMKVRTGRGVVPVAKVAVKKKGKGATKEARPEHQAAPGSTSVLTTGRIG